MERFRKFDSFLSIYKSYTSSLCACPALSFHPLHSPILWPHEIRKSFRLLVIMVAVGICKLHPPERQYWLFSPLIQEKDGIWGNEDSKSTRTFLPMSVMSVGIIHRSNVFHFVYTAAFGTTFDGPIARRLQSQESV